MLNTILLLLANFKLLFSFLPLRCQQLALWYPDLGGWVKPGSTLDVKSKAQVMDLSVIKPS